MRFLHTWPVPIQRRGVVVGVDGAWGVAVYFAVHWQVTVARDCDPLRCVNRVVKDRLGVRVCGRQLREHAATGGPVPLVCPDIFRSWTENMLFSTSLCSRISSWWSDVEFKDKWNLKVVSVTAVFVHFCSKYSWEWSFEQGTHMKNFHALVDYVNLRQVVKCLPFRDRTKDCQNLAFFDGVSFLPIISKWFLNILAVYVVLVSATEQGANICLRWNGSRIQLEPIVFLRLSASLFSLVFSCKTMNGWHNNIQRYDRIS